ncbi:MAG: methyl-accepting chemotaxis protein, partial [Oscillospiraceae bacterium]
AAKENIQKISMASDEQSDAVNQVELGVEQISTVVQTNSATAEESAASSEELSGQAQTLKDLLNKFELKKQDETVEI